MLDCLLLLVMMIFEACECRHAMTHCAMDAFQQVLTR